MQAAVLVSVHLLCNLHTGNFSVFWLCMCKLEQEQKLDEAGGGGGVREGTLAYKHRDFEKSPLVFTVEFIY